MGVGYVSVTTHLTSIRGLPCIHNPCVSECVQVGASQWKQQLTGKGVFVVVVFFLPPTRHTWENRRQHKAQANLRLRGSAFTSTNRAGLKEPCRDNTKQCRGTTAIAIKAREARGDKSLPENSPEARGVNKLTC